MINSDVVFEGIGAGDVIIVRIFASPDDTPRLILFAGDGLELHFHKAVFETGIVLNADRIGCLTRLLQDVRFARRGIVGNDFPSGFALAGLGRGPTRRRCSGFEIVGVDGVGGCEAGCEGAHNYKGFGCFHIIFCLLTRFINISSFCLLVTERLDRIEPRGFPGGVIAKGDSDGR